jgi:hypothetical protein
VHTKITRPSYTASGASLTYGDYLGTGPWGLVQVDLATGTRRVLFDGTKHYYSGQTGTLWSQFDDFQVEEGKDRGVFLYRANDTSHGSGAGHVFGYEAGGIFELFQCNPGCTTLRLSQNATFVAHEWMHANPDRQHVYLRDLPSVDGRWQAGPYGTLVTRAPDGTEANGSSTLRGIGASRWIVFDSDASNLDAADDNGQTDVFVYDRVRESTMLTSRHADGEPFPDGAEFAAISGNGQYIFFTAGATTYRALNPLYP